MMSTTTSKMGPKKNSTTLTAERILDDHPLTSSQLRNLNTFLKGTITPTSSIVKDSFYPLFQLNDSIHCRTYNPFHAQQKKRANKTDGKKCEWEQGTQVEDDDDDDNVHGKGGGRAGVKIQQWGVG